MRWWVQVIKRAWLYHVIIFPWTWSWYYGDSLKLIEKSNSGEPKFNITQEKLAVIIVTTLCFWFWFIFLNLILLNWTQLRVRNHTWYFIHTLGFLDFTEVRWNRDCYDHFLGKLPLNRWAEIHNRVSLAWFHMLLALPRCPNFIFTI